MNSAQVPRVAVVGAGIAGLSCAKALQHAGFSIAVFDKSRGPAGRMSTRRGEGWQCDHGAQYFTARDPAFQAEVARWCEAGVAAPWHPALRVIGGDAGRHPDAEVERFVGAPRMTAPARHLAETLDLSLGCTVTELSRTSLGWVLHFLESDVPSSAFDAVVIALPAPQARALLEKSASALSADSALVGVAGSVIMTGSWAVMLRYDQRPDLPFEAAFVNAGPLRWIARDCSKPGRRGCETWLLHATAEWSEAHIEDDADLAAGLLLEAFEALGGRMPQAWSAHRWRYADIEQPLERVFAWDAADGVGLCGDWLNGGKVEGAWLSGLRLAQQLELETPR